MIMFPALVLLLSHKVCHCLVIDLWYSVPVLWHPSIPFSVVIYLGNAAVDFIVSLPTNEVFIISLKYQPYRVHLL